MFLMVEMDSMPSIKNISGTQNFEVAKLLLFFNIQIVDLY